MQSESRSTVTEFGLLADFRELELFDLSNWPNRGQRWGFLIRDTISEAGVCWVRSIRAAEQLLTDSGYKYRLFTSGVGGCWYLESEGGAK